MSHACSILHKSNTSLLPAFLAARVSRRCAWVGGGAGLQKPEGHHRPRFWAAASSSPGTVLTLASGSATIYLIISLMTTLICFLLNENGLRLLFQIIFKWSNSRNVMDWNTFGLSRAWPNAPSSIHKIYFLKNIFNVTIHIKFIKYKLKITISVSTIVAASYMLMERLKSNLLHFIILPKIGVPMLLV